MFKVWIRLPVRHGPTIYLGPGDLTTTEMESKFRGRSKELA
jgi:hypothetical protein